MFNRIIRFATRHPKRVIALWAVVAIALGSLSSQLGYKVMTDDTAGFLPDSAESAQAAKYGQEHFGQQHGSRTVIVLVKRADSSAAAGVTSSATDSAPGSSAGSAPAASAAPALRAPAPLATGRRAPWSARSWRPTSSGSSG